MWYVVIIAIVIIIVLVIKNRNPGTSARGGQSLDEIKDPNKAQTVRATVVRKDICTPAQKDSRPIFWAMV